MAERALTETQRRMAAIDAKAYLFLPGRPADKRKLSNDDRYPPWFEVEEQATRLGVQHKTWCRWHKSTAYYEDYIRSAGAMFDNFIDECELADNTPANFCP